MAKSKTRRSGFAFFTSRALAAVVTLLSTYFGVCILLLALYNVIYPPITGVQLQRLVEALIHREEVKFWYKPVPYSAISPHLGNAVIAAEDGRFMLHNGIDWVAVEKALEDNRRRGRVWRGGSTITQQLVKNLFMTTHSSFVRKAFEIPLTYLAELLLPKKRILALYLNVIEWGRGVYGADPAARYYYGISAKQVGRYQAASLAAVIPSPRKRTPQRMGWYASIITRRMAQMGF